VKSDAGSFFEYFRYNLSSTSLVEAKTLIKSWFEPMLSEIEAVEDTLSLTKMSAEKLEEYGSTLRRLWSELIP
jgi:hypothetical protein